MSKLTCAVLAGVTAAHAAPAAGQFPDTFNFRDVTSIRVNSVVAEAADNEKEVEFGDFDNDGDLDVVIAVARADFGKRKNKLYRNDGGTFSEVSTAVPLFTVGEGDVARNAFFRDYDLDGWLDIIIVCDNNTGGDPGRTKLWINQHEGKVHTGWIEDGNARLGPSTGGAACGGFSMDADMDGDPELYVGNYPGPSQDTMYFNDDLNPGFFTEMTATHVPADGDYTVDVSSADLNGDGKVDLLISNHFDPNYLYYNDNLDAGSEVGDFRYTGSVQNLGNAGANENSMEPGDFDHDGDQDIYWSNSVASTGDRILRNDGNDAGNKAIFTMIDILPASATTMTSRKATVGDIDGDGRLDVIVMKEVGARPTVLRNTSVGGDMSFVDWTPAVAFPSGQTHKGWHAALFDTDGDGRDDVFLGGWNGDHLFIQTGPSQFDEADLGGVLTGVFNGNPAAVLGTAGPGDPDTYTINGLTSGGLVSVVLTGADDYLLEILDAGDNVLASADRGGLAVEEALQYGPGGTPSTLKVRVNVLSCATIHDLDGDCGVTTADLLELLGAWGKNPGHPADFDENGGVGTSDLLELLADWGASEYVVEVLARDG